MSERREPALGDVDHLDATAPPANGSHAASHAAASGERKYACKAPSRSRGLWLAGTVLVVAVVAVLLLWRGQIGARLVPVPKQALLMRDADRALAHGRLTSPDGRGASELYAAVLALDPDHQPAREGLARTGEAALAQARSALHRNNLEDARDDLALAHQLSVPMAEIQPLDAALREHTAAGTSISALLDQATAAERDGNLDADAQGALALYQRVLATDPGNAVALARRQALFVRLLDKVAAQAAAGDIDTASAIVDRVAAIDAADPDLPVARAQLAAARERKLHVQANKLDHADAALQHGRLDEAVAGYRAVLADAAGNARAIAGLGSAAGAYAQQADRETADFEFKRAEAILAKARVLAADAPAVRAAELHLHNARSHRGAGLPLRHAEVDTLRVSALLAAASRAMDNDHLLVPPGDSAYDKLRAADAIAPNDPDVRAAERRFGPAAVSCYQTAMSANTPERAEGCLDALAIMQPGYPRLASMRNALAERWLAIADERLGAGEFDAVRRALDAAHRLSPRLRGLPAMEYRLQQARVGTRH